MDRPCILAFNMFDLERVDRISSAVDNVAAAPRSYRPGAAESPSVAGSGAACIGHNPNSRLGRGGTTSPHRQGRENAMETYIGIDVAKGSFDLFDLSEEKHRRFDHTPAGIKSCLAFLASRHPALIVMESTGGYEMDIAVVFSEAGLPVAVVNPKRVRDFARATGRLAKTDKIDARLIAVYASTLQPPAQGVLEERLRILKGLVARRNQLVELRTAETNRREHIAGGSGDAIARSIAAVVKTIDRELAKIERELRQHINRTPELKRKVDHLTSVPGIGETTAMMLVANVPELGRLNRRQILGLGWRGPH